MFTKGICRWIMNILFYNESSFSCKACIKFLDLKSFVCYVKKYHRKSYEITSSPKFTFIPIDVWTCKMNWEQKHGANIFYAFHQKFTKTVFVPRGVYRKRNITFVFVFQTTLSSIQYFLRFSVETCFNANNFANAY